MIRIYFFVLSSFCFSIPLTSQKTLIDSLLYELESKKQENEKINILLDLAYAHLSSNPKKAIDYGQQTLKLAKKNQFDDGILDGFHIIGQGYEMLGEHEITLDYFQKGQTFAKNKEHTGWHIIFTNELGRIKLVQGMYNKATIYFLDGLKLAEVAKDSNRIAMTSGNLGAVHEKQKNFTQAANYIENALTIERKTGYIPGMIISLNNLGRIYLNDNKSEKAFPYITECLELAEELGNAEDIVIALNSIGHYYLKTQNLELAEENISRALAIAREIGDNFSLFNTLNTLGQINLEKQAYKKSNKYFKECLAISKQLKMKYVQKYLYHKVAITFAKMGNYAKAYEYTQFYIEEKDSLYSLETKKQIEELSIKYQTEKKEIENQLLKENQLLNELELRQKSTLLFVFVFLLLLSILLAYFYFTANRSKKLYNKQLRNKNKLLNDNIEKQKLIQQQTIKLEQVEKNKNKLLTNIAHELQTPLSIIQGLSAELIDSKEVMNGSLESLSIIIKNSKELSAITNQILQLNNSDKIDKLETIYQFSLSELIDHILPTFQFLAKKKGIIIYPPDLSNQIIDIYSDIIKIETILRNLLANAIKYTQNNGFIHIAYSGSKEGYHQILIKDNGRGIQKEAIPYIFDRYYQQDSKTIEGGFGIGLAVCKEYITSLNGTINVKSQLEEGSTFIVCLPKRSQTSIGIEKYQFPKIKASFPTILKSDAIAEGYPILLIAEDNIDFCKYLEKILRSEYHLVFVHDGQEAIEYLKKHTPDLIITDWMMPNLDGLNLVKHLKSSSKFNSIPIIMLTARSLVSDKLKVLRIGIDDYIIKPFEKETLKISIKNLLYAEDGPKIRQNTLPKEEQLKKVDQDWLMNIEETITAQINNFDLSVEQVGQKINMTPQHINRKIKALTGLTSKRYIQELRYWEARKMLETREYDSVKAVCFSVGFKDVKNFSRKFKERFGSYPSQYLQ